MPDSCDPSQTGRPAEIIRLPRHTAPPSVVAITSGKGGVGRTHVAVNLAYLWRAAGARVLMLDADVALGGADLLLGVAPEDTIADVIEGRASAADAVVHSTCGVDLLAASAGQWDLAVLGDERRHALLSAIDELEPEYDSVVIDTPGGLSPDALGFCAAAAEVVAVVTPEPASVEAVCAWLHALATTTSVRRVLVLANMVDSQGAGHEVFRRVVQRADQRAGVSARIALNYVGAIPLDATVGRASLRGEPFCCADAASPAAAAMAGVADAIGQHATRGEHRDRGGGGLFWRRNLRDSPRPPSGATTPC